MFMGEYHHNIDEKNRLVIPSKFREELGDEFVITRGLDNCLFIYPKNNWELIVEKLKKLPFTKHDARYFTRFFLSGASVCEVDRSGRVIIPTPLTTFANISKECVVIGANDRIEIWANDEWDKFMEDNSEQFISIAEDLFQVGDFDA